MDVQAQLSNADITPRKMRQVADLLVGLPVHAALAQLMFNHSKASEIAHKLLKSAIANAVNNNELQEDNLKVNKFIVGDGVKYRRYQPVSRGSAHPFKRRKSNIIIIINEIKPQAKKSVKNKSEITTLSIEELAKETQTSSAENLPEENEDDKELNIRNKDMEIYNKSKMRQRGGDKNKTHRRKSI